MTRRLLREFFPLREMSVEVPDEALPALRQVIKRAVNDMQLPSDALRWVPKPTKPSKEKKGKAKDEPEGEEGETPPLSDDDDDAPVTAKAHSGHAAKVAQKAKPEPAKVAQTPPLKRQVSDPQAKAPQKGPPAKIDPSKLTDRPRWTDPGDHYDDATGQHDPLGKDLPAPPKASYQVPNVPQIPAREPISSLKGMMGDEPEADIYSTFGIQRPDEKDFFRRADADDAAGRSVPPKPQDTWNANDPGGTGTAEKPGGKKPGLLSRIFGLGKQKQPSAWDANAPGGTDSGDRPGAKPKRQKAAKNKMSAWDDLAPGAGDEE